MISGKLVFLLVVILPLVVTETNYCDRELCRPHQHHVACNNNGVSCRDLFNNNNYNENFILFQLDFSSSMWRKSTYSSH